MHPSPSIRTTVNPFQVPPHRYSCFTYLKAAIVGVTIFPLRVVVLLAALMVGAVCGALAGCGLDARNQQPPSRLQRLLLKPVALTARCLLWACGVWYLPVEYRPGSCPGTARVFVVAPHFSLLDPFVMTYLEMPCSVSKLAVSYLPIVGKIAVAMRTIFVDRKDPDSKHKCVDAIRQRATDEAWPPLNIFPEGTCTNGDALIAFKPGPFIPGAPVQPVVLRYPYDVLSLSAASNDAEKRLFFSMFMLYNRVSVTYLPLYTPSPEEAADPLLFARNVREVMAAELQVPCTAHSYEDVWLAAKARQYGVEQTFEVKAVAALLQINADGVTALLERFHSLDTDGSGLLGIEEFATALGLEGAEEAYVAQLFAFFDVDGSGAISYAEFVQGLALLSPSTSKEEKIKLSFLLCDLNADGAVTLAELLRVLEMARAVHPLAPEDSASAFLPGFSQRLLSSSPAASEPVPGTPQHFFSRTSSGQVRAFASFDSDGDRVLTFDEFAAFCEEHAEVLDMSAALVRSRLRQADLLEGVSATVSKIKRESQAARENSKIQRDESTVAEPASAKPASAKVAPEPPPRSTKGKELW